MSSLSDYSEPPKASSDKVAFDAFNTNKHGWNEPPTLTQHSGTPSRIAPVRPTPSAGIYHDLTVQSSDFVSLDTCVNVSCLSVCACNSSYYTCIHAHSVP